MRLTTLTLIAGLLACLTTPAGSFSAEPAMQQPTLTQQQTVAQPIEERLDRLELQLQLIQQHLGIRLRPPATSPGAGTLTDQPSDYDRIGRLEREARRLDDGFQQMQSRLDRMATSGQTTPVTRGRLVVQNVTGVPHYLSVNKVGYYVQPGRTEIWVPYQVVEVYLPAHELPKLLGMSLWRWTGRDYEMPLEIKN